MSNKYYRNKDTDRVWWLNNPEVKGEFVFSFDKETNYNLFADYPWKLTKKQKQIFDRENPKWAEFFSDRK